MEIRVIDSIERLLYYKAEWESMLKQTNNDIIFHELDWIILWWKHFYDRHKLFVLIIINNMEIVGIGPLMITNKGLYKEIGFIGGRQSSRMDFIIRDKCREDVLKHMFDFLRSLKGNNIIKLHGMASNSKNIMPIKDYLKVNNIPSIFQRTVCYFLNLNDNDFNTYFKSRFGKETRYKMNKKERKLKELGSLDYKKVSISEAKEIFGIHEKRWLRKMGNSSFSKGRTREFYKELASYRKAEFEATIDAVAINDRIISFIYGVQYNKKTFLIRIAHDDDFYMLSPGEIVWKKKVEECFSSGISVLDFGPGYEPYKARWTDNYDEINTVTLPSSNILSNLIFYIKYWIGTKLIIALKKNELLNRCRKYQLGKLKFLLSKDNILRIKRIISKTGFLSYLISIFIYSAGRIFSYNQYLILEKQLSNIESSQNGMYIKEAGIDDLEALAELMNTFPSNIVRRYINKHKCLITFYNEEIIHCCWVGCSNIFISNVELNIQLKNTDAYIYDSYIKENYKSEYILTCIMSGIFDHLYEDRIRSCYIAVNNRVKSFENEMYKAMFMPRYKIYEKKFLNTIEHKIIELNPK